MILSTIFFLLLVNFAIIFIEYWKTQLLNNYNFIPFPNKKINVVKYQSLVKKTVVKILISDFLIIIFILLFTM